MDAHLIEHYWRGFIDGRTGHRYGPRPQTDEEREAYIDGRQVGLALARAERNEKTKGN